MQYEMAEELIKPSTFLLNISIDDASQRDASPDFVYLWSSHSLMKTCVNILLLRYYTNNNNDLHSVSKKRARERMA